MSKSKFIFDEDKANRAVYFIEHFITHVKGEKAGQPFILEPWQKDQIIKPIFGYVDKKTNLRQYRTAYIEIPRKNGKSSLCAAIALYVLFADSERGAEIYSAAGDRAQAGIVFSIAKQMVLNNPELSKRAKVFRNSIVFGEKGNTYKAISADAYTKHGFNAHCVIMDELHTQPNRDLYDVLVTSTASRTQPLIFSITTAGYDKTSICFEQHEYAKKLKKGILKDNSFLPVIYACDKDDDIHSVNTWKKANPNYGVSVRKDYLKHQSLKVKNLPSYENTFKRLHLNLWTTNTVKNWINDEIWDKCNIRKIEEKDLIGRKCYAGLDLSSTRDLTALVFLFPDDEHKKFDVLPYFWCPEDSIFERSKKEHIHYEKWRKEGLLFGTEGNVVDYEQIKNLIIELGGKFDIQQIAYDRWNSSQLVIELLNEGAPMTPYGQGFASMSAPTKELEKLIFSKALNHGGNELLKWQISNVVLQTDPTGSVKPNKAKSKEKIDGIVALVMSLGIFMVGQSVAPTTSVYEGKGIDFF